MFLSWIDNYGSWLIKVDVDQSLAIPVVSQVQNFNAIITRISPVEILVNPVVSQSIRNANILRDNCFFTNQYPIVIKCNPEKTLDAVGCKLKTQVEFKIGQHKR